MVLFCFGIRGKCPTAELHSLALSTNEEEKEEKGGKRGKEGRRIRGEGRRKKGRRKERKKSGEERGEGTLCHGTLHGEDVLW